MKGLRAKQSVAGTASVEIVVMLPLVITLFAAVYFFYNAGRAELDTKQAARACAWHFVMSGCEDTGGLCQGLVPRKGDALGDADNGRAADSRFQSAQERHTGAFAKLENIPLVSGVVTLIFGEGAHATASRKITSFGSESTTTNTVDLVCNTVSESMKEKVKDALCGMADNLLGMKVPGC